MIEQAPSVLPASQVVAAGSAVIARAGDEHSHAWRRLPDAVGLFCCAGLGCQWFAVCPACLGSLDVALRLRDGVEGMALYWCAAHGDGGEGAP